MTLNNFTYSNELFHHGVRGQRWGIRRYQNEDGSYKPGAEGRYDPDSISGKIHSSFSKSYQEKYGVSKEKADEAAARDIEFAKKAAIAAAAVTLTAAGIYAYKKYGMEYADEVLKAGTTFQTLSMDENRLNNGKAFYTAYTENDKKTYAGEFGKDEGEAFGIKTGSGENKYKLQATTEKDVKIASLKSSEKVFNEMMKNDAEFRSLVEKNSKKPGFNGAKTAYEKFNARNLLENDDDSKKLQEKFYGELSKRGYQGVADVNDRKYSGFNTKAAIIFDNDSFRKNAQGAMDVKVEKLSDAEIEAGKKHVANKAIKDVLMTPSSAATVSAYAAVIATSMQMSGSQKKLQSGSNNKSSSSNSTVKKEAKQYLKDHPESKMSLAEAEKMLSKKK